MQFSDFLTEKEAATLEVWTNQVLDAYPDGAVGFLKSKKDRFANPLGHTLRQGILDLFKAIRDNKDETELSTVLERILLIRAVEDLSPSQAVSFIFGLKQIVRRQRGNLEVVDWHEAWPVFEGRIDAVALLAFDIYAACRERLYRARISEIKSGRYILSDGAVCPSALMRQEKEQSKVSNDEH